MSLTHSSPRQRTNHRDDQPYLYTQQDRCEPDWRRFPGWRHVGHAEWESAQWQRAHCVKNVSELHSIFGDLLPGYFYADLVRDQEQYATMPLLVPPQMLNTIVPDHPPDQDSIYADPVRRYMIPVASDRAAEWPSHPLAGRDPLHEHEMWPVEGLTHRYPTKVLLEILRTRI